MSEAAPEPRPRGGVFSHAIIFGLAPLLQKIVGLVLLPFYTHFLSPRDYGEIDVLTIATGAVGLIFSLELRQGYIRAWIAAPDRAAKARLYSAAAGLLGLLGLLGSIGFFAASRPLAHALLGRDLAWPYRAVVASGVFFYVANMVPSATLQADLRAGRMVSISLLQFICAATTTIVAVVWLGLGPEGFFLGGAVAAALGIGAIGWMLRDLMVWRVDPWATLAGPLVYALPLLFSGIGYFIVRNSDRFLVSRLMSVADLGLYSLAWSLANLLLTFVFLPLQTSLDVWRFRMHQQGGQEAAFARVLRSANLLTAIAAIGLCSFAADAFAFSADARYGKAMLYVPVLAAAVLLQVGYTVVASPFFVKGSTREWAWVQAGAAVLQVGATLAMVPLLGVLGAAIANVVTNGFLYAMAALRGPRHWAVPFDHRAVLTVIALGTALSMARRFTPIDSLLLAGLADAATCLAFLLALWALGLARPGEIAELLAPLWQKLRARLA